MKIKIRNRKIHHTTPSELVGKNICLEALCVYRDQLIMSDKYETPEVQVKLSEIYDEINNIRETLDWY